MLDLYRLSGRSGLCASNSYFVHHASTTAISVLGWITNSVTLNATSCLPTCFAGKIAQKFRFYSILTVQMGEKQKKANVHKCEGTRDIRVFLWTFFFRRNEVYRVKLDWLFMVCILCNHTVVVVCNYHKCLWQEITPMCAWLNFCKISVYKEITSADNVLFLLKCITIQF